MVHQHTGTYDVNKMDMLASYDEDTEHTQDGENTATEQNSLEDQYSMFEKMIGGIDTENTNASTDDSGSDDIGAKDETFHDSTDKPTSALDTGKCSLAESVKRFMEKNSEQVEEGISRSKSVSSESASSRESSKSRSPSSSPDRENRERAASANSVENEEVKPTETRSSVSPSKRKRSKSRSPSHKRSDHKSSRRKSGDGKKDGHSSRSRRHKRSRSKDRKHKRRHGSHDRKKSRSHSRDRHKKHKRSRSRDKHASRSKRSRSHHKSPHRHHRSPDRRRRSRSRSPTRKRRSPTTANKPFTFKDQMRQQLLKASKILQSAEGIDGRELDLPKEKPSNLPLNSKDIFSAISSGSGVTPQMALLQTMATMHQKAQEMTGIAVPKYYNPAAVNPLKYAEQVQKRKLLWSKAKDHKEDKEKEWKTSAALASDSDGKTKGKFFKLMGIKQGESDNQTEETETVDLEERKKQHDELFSRLDKDYEFARMTTHTQRGVGLGFSSSHQFQPQHP